MQYTVYSSTVVQCIAVLMYTVLLHTLQLLHDLQTDSLPWCDDLLPASALPLFHADVAMLKCSDHVSMTVVQYSVACSSMQ